MTPSLLTNYTAPAPGTPTPTNPNPNPTPANVQSFYDALEHDLSVAPGIPRTKKCYLKHLRDPQTGETIGTIEEDTAGWKPYQTMRATAEVVERWLRKWPDANPLVITGKVSGVIVLDMDGIEAFATLRAKGYPPPTAMTAVTKSPGGEFREHYWYRYPEGLGRIANFASGYDHELPHVDLRADGGLVVYPGGIHRNGGRYGWLDGLSPDKWGIALADGWLADYIGEHNRAAERQAAERAEQLSRFPDPIAIGKSGNRENRLRPYAAAAFRNEVERVRAAIPTTRNDRLFKSTAAVSRYVTAGMLAESEVWREFEHAAADCRLTADDGLSATRRTIESGLRRGADNPITLRENQRPASGTPMDYLSRRGGKRPGAAWRAGLIAEMQTGGGHE